MKTIKIASNITPRYFVRQSPSGDCMWKGNRYIITDDIDTCDWVVVYESFDSEFKVSCPRSNTILITGEPPDVKTYHPGFLKQFQTVLTCHKGIDRQNTIMSQQALPWMLSIYKNDQENIPNDYDSFLNDKNYSKSKILSVISSNKQITPGHRARYKFVQALKQYFGENVDVFGAGINLIPDKWEGIRPYKYHIAIENGSIPDYWTEKLADTFLANTYPIYHGCTNIYDYFPEKSMSVINIENIDKSIKKIEKIISEGRFERSKNELQNAKEMILNKYNLYEVIHQLIRTRQNSQPSLISIKPEKDFYWKNKLVKLKKKVIK